MPGQVVTEPVLWAVVKGGLGQSQLPPMGHGEVYGYRVTDTPEADLPSVCARWNIIFDDKGTCDDSPGDLRTTNYGLESTRLSPKRGTALTHTGTAENHPEIVRNICVSPPPEY